MFPLQPPTQLTYIHRREWKREKKTVESEVTQVIQVQCGSQAPGEPTGKAQSILRSVPIPCTTPTLTAKPNAFHHFCWPTGPRKGRGTEGPKQLGVTLWYSRLGLLCRCHFISLGLIKRRSPARGWSLRWDKEKE